MSQLNEQQQTQIFNEFNALSPAQKMAYLKDVEESFKDGGENAKNLLESMKAISGKLNN